MNFLTLGKFLYFPGWESGCVGGHHLWGIYLQQIPEGWLWRDDHVTPDLPSLSYFNTLSVYTKQPFSNGLEGPRHLEMVNTFFTNPVSYWRSSFPLCELEVISAIYNIHMKYKVTDKSQQVHKYIIKLSAWGWLSLVPLLAFLCITECLLALTAAPVCETGSLLAVELGSSLYMCYSYCLVM